MSGTTGYRPPAGLCASCANVRIVESRTGSRFYLCEVSRINPAYPKYPPIPVLRCRAYVPSTPGAASEEG